MLHTSKRSLKKILRILAKYLMNEVQSHTLIAWHMISHTLTTSCRSHPRLLRKRYEPHGVNWRGVTILIWQKPILRKPRAA